MISEAEAKSWTIAHLTADQLVSKKACFVKHVSMTTNDGGASTVLVYDGWSTSGKLKLSLSALTSTFFVDEYEIPIYFSNGIYVDVGDNMSLFNIQFKEESNLFDDLHS